MAATELQTGTRRSADDGPFALPYNVAGSDALLDVGGFDASFEHHPATMAPPKLRDRLIVLTIGARWLTASMGTVVAVQDGAHAPTMVAAVLLGIIALSLTLRHTQIANLSISAGPVFVELAVCVAALGLSGGLTSPFVLAPAIPIMLAGFVLSDRQAVVLAYAALLATGSLSFVQRGENAAERSAALIGVVYLLCGVLGVFTRRVVSDMGEQHLDVLVEVNRLGQANALLVELHSVAQRMPASLDLVEVVTALRDRLHTQFDHSVLSLVIRNAATGQWHHELAEGVRELPPMSEEELPAPLRAALEKPGAFRVADYLVTETHGVSSFARSGLYCALRTRNQVVGVIAIEDDNARRYDLTEVAAMDGLSNELALTLDNAVWFGRLRTLGAETERARIARDLHDRIAQSMAYVSFELERMCDAPTPPTSPQLTGLREVIHDVVIELRDTLYDLRASISATDNLVAVTRQYAGRFQERHNIAIEFTCAGDWNVPTTVEQELWRIVQEALHNIAKHARADRVHLRYFTIGTTANIEVRDNGCGFAPKTVTSGHFGLMGMRERADAIGATIEIDSHPGRGTAIRISVEVTP